ncbi:MAG: hypothetical protein ACNA7K_06350 [Acholeplasmataceae bacterium]
MFEDNQNQDHINTLVIRGKTLEFIPKTHTYIYDGMIIPSVSEIVAKLFPSTYKDVDPFVLQQAANKGILLHKEIERYETEDVKGHSEEFKNYLKIKKNYDFKVIDNEQMILIEHEGQPLCAGRLDMIIDSMQETGIGIADIKRTYDLHMDRLMIQLNLYKIGYEQTYQKEIHYLRCIHLRYQHFSYVNVPIDTDILKQLIAIL